MNRKQEDAVSKKLTEEFGHVINDYKEIFKKMPPKLKAAAFDDHNGGFRKYHDGFYMEIAGFDNYIWAGHASGKENDKKFINDLINEMKRDLQNLKAALQAKCPGVKIVLLDVDLGSFESWISMVRKYNYCSNDIRLYAMVPKAKCMKYIPSDRDIKDSEKRKFIELYDEYANFMKHPRKLSGGFWAGHLNDISRIIGMSADTFNSIVSKNIGRPSGKPINGSMFENDPEWGKSMQKKLGDCVDLGWFSDADQLLYSIPNKKVYWANYEHTDLEVFFNEFPYNSKEFEDALYDNADEKKDIFNVFKERDQEKGYGLIK